MKKPPTGKEPVKNPPKKDARGLFVVGNNGGKGRPKGAPDRRTAPFRAKIDQALPAILDGVVSAAKGGDMAAARILIDKSLPNLKPVEVARPLSLSGDTLTERAASVVDAVSGGKVSVDEGVRLIQALASMGRIVETDALEKRITALEAQTTK